MCLLNDTNNPRAFSDLFGKYLVPVKLGKNSVILEKNSMILGQIEKEHLLNLGFLLLGNVPVNWKLFQPLEEKFGTGNRTQFCIEKKPCNPEPVGIKPQPLDPQIETLTLKPQC